MLHAPLSQPFSRRRYVLALNTYKFLDLMKMIEFADVETAREKLKDIIKRTPLVYSKYMSEISGLAVYLKLDNFQVTGSFKVRGVLNRMLYMSKVEKKKGVITASSGNHGKALAFAARRDGVPAIIVVPETTPRNKIEAIQHLDAEVILHGAIYDDAEQKAKELAEQRGMNYVHSYLEPLAWAGYGSIALEILEDLPNLDAIVAPIGGGGLITGVAFSAKSLRPSVKVFGVEPAGAPAMSESLKAGKSVRLEKVESSADGLISQQISDITVATVREYVDKVVLVSDEEIAETICLLLDYEKILVELAGAASVAAIVKKRIDLLQGSKVVCIISGGNLDLQRLAGFIKKSPSPIYPRFLSEG
ncbi:MAG: threonine/serine dehydratase [Candidatus Hodarchaeota archaeon]